jgi:predicted GNAT family N-acyltransferase
MVRIEIMAWEQAQPVAGPIRFAAFVEEQGVNAGVEIDDDDPKSVHAVAFDEKGKAVGTGRLLPDGRIGRMAVVKEWRRQGVGAEILKALMEAAKLNGHKEVVLAAQLGAAEFYREQGFQAEGKVFQEAGILHQMMRKTL